MSPDKVPVNKCAPLNVTFPPIVIVDTPLLTPVPPYVGDKGVVNPIVGFIPPVVVIGAATLILPIAPIET